MFVICILTIVRCKDDDDLNPDTDYLIFRHFYGECVGEGCIEIFKLNGHDLFEDKNDRYPNFDDFYKGSYKRLPKKKFESVNGLIESFPLKLFNEEKIEIEIWELIRYSTQYQLWELAKAEGSHSNFFFKVFRNIKNWLKGL